VRVPQTHAPALFSNENRSRGAYEYSPENTPLVSVWDVNERESKE